MVKIGFIVEGDSERIIIESEAFVAFLKRNNYELIFPVINAEGGGNLLPHNIEVMVQTLKNQNAEKIFVLTDLEQEISIQAVKNRISHSEVEEIFIAIKALEAWFLADTNAMRGWLKQGNFFEEDPENTTAMPWLRLKEIARINGSQGPGNKIAFAKKMVKYFGFSITNSATHPNCESATTMITTLES